MGRIQGKQVTPGSIPVDRRCKYGKVAECKTCEHVVYRSCPTFLKHHCAYLTADIKPLKETYDKDAQDYVKGPVLYVQGNDKYAVGRLQSNAVNWALRTNNRVIRIDTGRALSCVMSPRDAAQSRVSDWWNQARGFYCDFTKLNYANDKSAEIMSVLLQFISTVVEEGAHVFVRSDYQLEGFNWIRL